MLHHWCGNFLGFWSCRNFCEWVGGSIGLGVLVWHSSSISPPCSPGSCELDFARSNFIGRPNRFYNPLNLIISNSLGIPIAALLEFTKSYLRVLARCRVTSLNLYTQLAFLHLLFAPHAWSLNPWSFLFLHCLRYRDIRHRLVKSFSALNASFTLSNNISLGEVTAPYPPPNFVGLCSRSWVTRNGFLSFLPPTILVTLRFAMVCPGT